MKKYIKTRILGIKRGLTLEQKQHVISSVYDRLAERKYKVHQTGSTIAEVLMERMNEIRFLMELNEAEFHKRRPRK